MSAPATMPEELLTWEDLERRWKPPMADPTLRRQWLRRSAARWGLRPMLGTRGATARFAPAAVKRAEERASGLR